MATAARDVLLTEQLAEVESVVSVETRLIDAGARLRPVDMIWAQALGELMLREGQRTPIDICVSADGTRFELAGAGGHRLAAAQLVGIEHLKAFVHSADLAERRQREISENLWRRDLDPLDRAAFIAELVQLKRAKAGADRTKHRDASVPQHLKRRVAEEADTALETISNVYGFTEEIGEQLGLSGRTLRNDLLIYRGLAPSLVKRLREVRHPILSNASQLRGLAKLEGADQGRAVDMLVGDLGNPAKSLSEALGRMKSGLSSDGKDPAEKRFGTIISTIRRMGAAERLGLFQSPAFHDVMPAQARELLAPMRRDGSGDQDDDTGHEATDAGSGKAGFPGAGRTVLDRGYDANSGRPLRGAEGAGDPSNDPALARGSRVSAVPADEVAPLKPAVPIRTSVKLDHLVCLECGEKVEHLKAHLRDAHQMKPADYLARWRLPGDYPMVAPNYADARREQAKRLGLKGAAK